MWECSVCHRKFKNKNQDHSCMVRPLEEHFIGRPVNLEQVVRKILDKVESLGEVRISSVKNAILVSAESTFLALKVKKDRVEIEFVLNEEKEGFPVYKTIRISKRRVAHFVAVGDPEEVDEQLLEMIREAQRGTRDER